MKNLQLADFPLPETRKMESQLLATIISDPSTLYSVIRVIKDEMFSSEENKKIWRVALDMFNNKESISLATILPKVDRGHFLREIMAQTPLVGAFELDGLLGAFTDTYIKRIAYFTSLGILQKINGGASCADIEGDMENFTKEVNEGLRDDSTKSTAELAESLAEKLENGKVNRIPTSIPSVDYLTYGGFNGGNLIILAARPSVGKTTIAMQMALNASRIGKKTLVCSFEMTSEELVQRLILSTGYITPAEFYARSFDWDKYNKAMGEVCNKNLVINDKTSSIDELCQRIKIESQSGKCEFVVVDYLGLIPITNTRLNVATALGEFTRKLKNTAKECNIPILLLCQLNRLSASENRSPQLHDLRDSGAIEQDADIVLMLERAKDSEGTTLDNRIDLWVRKDRNGKCNFDNPIRLLGNDTYSNFVEQND